MGNTPSEYLQEDPHAGWDQRNKWKAEKNRYIQAEKDRELKEIHDKKDNNLKELLDRQKSERKQLDRKHAIERGENLDGSFGLLFWLIFLFIFYIFIGQHFIPWQK